MKNFKQHIREMEDSTYKNYIVKSNIDANKILSDIARRAVSGHDQITSHLKRGEKRLTGIERAKRLIKNPDEPVKQSMVQKIKSFFTK
jgi:hypothetical protein